MAGRKTDCTPETTKTIADNISIGLSNRDACALAGIVEATYYNWLNRGQAELDRVNEDSRRKILKSELPFVEFLEAIKKAIPRRKQRLVGIIQKATPDQWQAAAWLLERLHFEEFGRKDRLQVDWRQSLPDGYDPDEVQRQFVEMMRQAQSANSDD